MTRLESKKVKIEKSAAEVYAFFSKFGNYRSLMPSSVERYEADDDSCTIGIKNMGSLPMKIVKREDGRSVLAEKNGQAMFNFTFEFAVQPLTDSSCEAQLILNADLNPMLRMVASKPLVGFLDILLERYQKPLN